MQCLILSPDFKMNKLQKRIAATQDKKKESIDACHNERLSCFLRDNYHKIVRNYQVIL